MAIYATVQTTVVDGVGSITTSDIVQDPVTGKYVRVFQIFTPPDDNGNTTLQFTLRLIADNLASQVDLTAPIQVY